MKQNNFFATAFAALLLFPLSGCSNTDSRYSKVEGTVTYNGVAVEGATVSFQPVTSEGESASGRTDANGRFTLTSASAQDGGRGALPGEYRVAIEKREVRSDPDQEAFDRGEITYDDLQERQERNRGVSTPPRDLLPVKYKTASGSGLTATVTPGRNSPFNFELTDD